MAITMLRNEKQLAGEEAGAATMEKAKEVAGKAKEAAVTVAEKAKEMATSVAHTTGEVATNVGHKAEQATTAVGTGMQSLAHQLESGGRYLEEGGLKGIGEDMTNLIRRNPVPAVLIGIGLGFLLARLTRN